MVELSLCPLSIKPHSAQVQPFLWLEWIISPSSRPSQRRGQWVRLHRKIDELEFRATVYRREATEAEARDIANCRAELVTLEAAMEAAGQVQWPFAVNLPR